MISRHWNKTGRDLRAYFLNVTHIIYKYLLLIATITINMSELQNTCKNIKYEVSFTYYLY